MHNQFKYMPYFQIEVFSDATCRSTPIHKFNLNDDPLDITRMEHINIQEVTITNNLSSIVIDLKMIVGDRITESLTNPGLLETILSDKNFWKIKYGWNGIIINENCGEIKRLKLDVKNINIEYNPTYRAYEFSLKLISSQIYGLTKLKMQYLINFIQKVKNNNGNKSKNPSLSLFGIINEIISEYNEIVGSNEKIFMERSVKTDDEGNPIQNTDNWLTSAFSKVGSFFKANAMLRSNSITPFTSNLDAKDISDINRDNIILTETTINLNEEDKIDLKDIRLNILKSTKADCKFLKDSFKEDDISKDSNTLKKLFDPNYLNMSVRQFLLSLLEEFGFGLQERAGNINDNQGYPITVIYNMDNTSISDTTFHEVEYRFNESDLSENEKSSRYYFEPDNTQNIFNLQSKYNVIKSISANITDGENNLYSAQFESKMMEKVDWLRGKNIDDLEDETQVPFKNSGICKNVNSYMDFIATKSKKVSIESILLPLVRVHDDINIVLFAKILSGRYKVLEVKHNISKTNAGTTLSLQQICQNKEANNDNDIVISPRDSLAPYNYDEVDSNNLNQEERKQLESQPSHFPETGSQAESDTLNQMENNKTRWTTDTFPGK